MAVQLEKEYAVKNKIEEQKSDKKVEPIKRSRNVDEYVETSHGFEVAEEISPSVNTLGGQTGASLLSRQEYAEIKLSSAQVKQIILNVAALTNQLVTDEKPALDAEIISKLNDRVILIEDTHELQCTAADCVSMRAMRTFSMLDCLRIVLRMTPDRIVVGEVRGDQR